MEARMSSETFKFECPFGEEDDCPNEITVELGGGCIDDAYGCHHVDPLPADRAQRLWDLIDDRYMARYDEAMESRVDNWRDRDNA
jgi:hypothetical protein